MTISELAECIEGRLAELQWEIVGLRAADEALTATGNDAAAPEPAPDPHAPALAPPVFDWANRRREPDQAAARRASKPRPYSRLPASWTPVCATAPDSRRHALLGAGCVDRLSRRRVRRQRMQEPTPPRPHAWNPLNA